jgi:SAM-dependent methyltransferase
MIKRYLKDEYGQGPEFWDRNWNRFEIDVTNVPVDVDRRLVRHIGRYLNADMRILEGGCGDCKYVRYFSGLGLRVVGVDFAEETVRTAKLRWPHLDIRLGDIGALAFPANEFDAYYSGGVIEHFENGVESQLCEAHRVVKPGGYLFVVVPYLNLARALSSTVKGAHYKADLDGRSAWLEPNLSGFSVAVPPCGYHFHEYIFSTREMRTILARHQFEILEETPFSSDFGLLDIGFFRWCHGTDRRRRNALNKAFTIPLRLLRWFDNSSYLSCDRFSTLFGLLVGNLQLFVCRVVK